MKQKINTRIAKVWLSTLLQQGYSKATIRSYNNNLLQFLLYITALNKLDIRQINREDVETYLSHIRVDQLTGRPLAGGTINCKLKVMRQFFKWAETEGHIFTSPLCSFEETLWAKQETAREALTEEELEKLIDTINIHNPKGFRDKTVIELLYTTGIRKSELVNLDVGDIDFAGALLFIRQGKGGKDRVIPLTESCLAYLAEYIKRIRITMLKKESKEEALFLNRFGDRFASNTTGRIVREYARAAGIKKKVSTHTLRHTFASHMINNGAHVRYVQELLGHAKVSTTMIYTKCNLTDLKKAIRMYHPKENQLYEVVNRVKNSYT